MSIFNIKQSLIASALLLLLGSAAQASTLWVNCGGKGGLNSIGVALKLLQSPLALGPNAINVSGACRGPKSAVFTLTLPRGDAFLL
jgi:hypothetical protein